MNQLRPGGLIDEERTRFAPPTAAGLMSIAEQERRD